jgi:hypothetical protein
MPQAAIIFGRQFFRVHIAQNDHASGLGTQIRTGAVRERRVVHAGPTGAQAVRIGFATYCRAVDKVDLKNIVHGHFLSEPQFAWVFQPSHGSPPLRVAASENFQRARTLVTTIQCYPKRCDTRTGAVLVPWRRV